MGIWEFESSFCSFLGVLVLGFGRESNGVGSSGYEQGWFGWGKLEIKGEEDCE